MIAVALLLGCPSAPGTDDPDDPDTPAPPDCFTSDPTACLETFCGPPAVRAATGFSEETFRVLDDGDALPITWGAGQGGYHVDLAFLSTNLCPVVFVDFELLDVTGGAETLVHSSTRHVQAIRGEDAEPPSEQRWWPEQFRFPCAYWPDDPDHEPSCGAEPIASLEDLDLELRIAVADHNVDRSAAVVVSVDATFGD